MTSIVHISPYVLPGLPITDNHTANKILQTFCDKFSVRIEKVKSPDRSLKLHKVRCMYVGYLKSSTKLSLKTIGGILGGRNHATIIHAEMVHKNMLATDETYATNYFGIVKHIKYGTEFKMVLPPKKKRTDLTPSQKSFQFKSWVRSSKENDFVELGEQDYNSAMFILGEYKNHDKYKYYRFKTARMGNGIYKITRVM